MFEDDNAVALDFESFYDTRSDYSLSCMPTWKYCADDRFDPYLVSLCGKDIFEDERDRDPNTVHRVLDDGRQLYVGRPELFRGWGNLEGRIICMHNASFDEAVLLECWKRGILPRLKNVKFVCTADLSSFLMVPRNLKGAMKYLFGKEISKEVRAGMDGRHDYDLPKKDYDALLAYSGDDAVECHDIWLKYAHEWPDLERAISEMNREATIRGIMLDRQKVADSVKELGRYLAGVVCDVPWYPEKAVGSLPALRQAVVALGIEPPKSFKKDDPGFLDWLKDHDDIPFIKARQRAVSINVHLARLRGMLDTVEPNGTSHPVFLYGGSHTLRFSGKSDGSKSSGNLLNLPRKPVLSGDEHVFGGDGVDLRGMYVARPGHKFVIFDYSQIEARFSLWLVGDTHMMEALKREGNLYQANAVAMGWCRSGEEIKKTDPDKYRLAKCCLHGDTPILVRSEKKDGGLTKPYYKRIIRVTPTDRVWDGHEWVRHLGVEKMKEVKSEELVEIGGVCLTRDHRVYIGETESRRADEILGDEQAAAMAWGDAHNPVRGWAHVRILAAYLAGTCARALGLCAREALHILARALHLHGVWRGDVAPVGQRPEGADDEVREVRAQGVQEEGRGEHVGEGAR